MKHLVYVNGVKYCEIDTDVHDTILIDLDKVEVPRENVETIKEAPIPMPPLGLEPRRFQDERRLAKVENAIRRYLEAQMQVPEEWVTEYNELIDRLEKR